jgi:hypothetical protein
MWRHPALRRLPARGAAQSVDAGEVPIAWRSLALAHAAAERLCSRQCGFGCCAAGAPMRSRARAARLRARLRFAR